MPGEVNASGLPVVKARVALYGGSAECHDVVEFHLDLTGQMSRLSRLDYPRILRRGYRFEELREASEKFAIQVSGDDPQVYGEIRGRGN